MRKENQLWIQDNIKSLQVIIKKVDGEETLKSYIVALIRLLNGLMQIEKTFFHQYEKKILVEPMKLFCTYFQEQVIRAVDECEPGNKVSYINDLEEALCVVAGIYENVINGTANADKQMFMSTPINSSLYEISPKLYSWYGEIIKEVVSLYDEEEPRYAFLLNPTLKNSLSAQTLFNERKTSGKVVVINMPVRKLDDISDMPLYIMHEMFHVLTKRQRNRRKRAYYLSFLLINQIGIHILDNTSFSDDAEKNKKIKIYLFDKFFLDVQKKLKAKFDEKGSEDRFFYSISIKAYLERAILKKMIDISESIESLILNNVYENYFNDEEYISDFHEFDKDIANLMNQVNIIKRNISNMRYYNTISYILDRLLFFFREIYADLICLWTSGYEIQKYQEAFKKTVNFNIVERQMQDDDSHKIRQSIIKSVFEDEVEIPVNNLRVYTSDKHNIREISGNYLIADNEFFRIYTEYFKGCIHDMELYIYEKRKMDELDAFRNKISSIVQADCGILYDITLGK